MHESNEPLQLLYNQLWDINYSFTKCHHLLNVYRLDCDLNIWMNTIILRQIYIFFSHSHVKQNVWRLNLTISALLWCVLINPSCSAVLILLLSTDIRMCIVLGQCGFCHSSPRWHFHLNLAHIYQNILEVRGVIFFFGGVHFFWLWFQSLKRAKLWQGSLDIF